MTPDLLILLTLTACFLVRSWWERKRDRRKFDRSMDYRIKGRYE